MGFGGFHFLVPQNMPEKVVAKYKNRSTTVADAKCGNSSVLVRACSRIILDEHFLPILSIVP